MALGRLGVTNIRNIPHAELEFGSGANLFFGQNGSGKTSLLEAIYFLGSGRTFRSQSADPLIRHGEEKATVFGELREASGGMTRLGVQRSRDGTREIRINGETVPRTSELARLLPTLVLGPQTVDLILGSPQLRRRFLNWGVFHVEPSFSDVWEQYNRALRQRNHLLKNPAAPSRELAIWNDSLAELAARVDAQRRGYFSRFDAEFSSLSDTIMGEKSVNSRYYSGWEEGRDLSAVLHEQEDSDRRRGFTQSGPHRADIRIRIAGQNAANVLSRGELKVLAWTLVLAQGACFHSVSGLPLTWLVDDLASELDENHREEVSRLLEGPDNQVFVTGIERAQLEQGWRSYKLFHVEHGSFHEKETSE